MNVTEMFSLKGKIALITGGAGLYGRQIVAALAQAGARTYMASRNVEALEAYACELRKQGYDVRAIKMDQGDEKSVLAARDTVIEESGTIDILVNNAVARTMKGWNDDIANFAESMRINATGLFCITRAFGDVMFQKGSGSIINIGSIQGMIGPDNTLYEGLSFTGYIPDYFFHKGGIENFTRYVASQYGSHNVRCNCIAPGGFQTEKQDPVFVERYSKRTFLNRMANSTDLMGIIVLLASDASKYITGANIPVDGGYTAK